MSTILLILAFSVSYVLGFVSCLAALAFIIRRAERSVLAAKKSANVRDLYPKDNN